MYTDIYVKADFLREYLKKNELSESQFAEIIGVSHSTVNRIFNGKRNPGSKFIAGVLKNFNNLSFDQVFTYELNLPKGKFM
ncbi:helix-turn-helix transcriptional regulator [Paenibacillus alvei]